MCVPLTPAFGTTQGKRSGIPSAYACVGFGRSSVYRVGPDTERIDQQEGKPFVGVPRTGERASKRHEGSHDMNGNTPQLQEPTVTLPASAPLVRITAGVGSAGQKTWNLRRPVTLIGSSRPAHIVLHDKDISKAHCVIVNTGTDVLIKDLRTSGGTLCNRSPIDVAVLADGDVITIGSNNIQVAIHLPEDASDDSSAGLQFVDPVKFPKPIDIRLIHTDQLWTVDDAIVLIGRHELAAIRLDHEDVSIRHAVIFRFGDRPAVFDLGCRTGIWVSGKRSSTTMLADGDCLTIGPFGLSIGSPDVAALKSQQLAPVDDPILQALLPRACVHSDTSEAANQGGSNGAATPTSGPVETDTGRNHAASSKETPSRSASLESADVPGHAMVSSIGETWDQLNEWNTKESRPDHPADAGKADELVARTAELDRRDAELRGQLHDVARMSEQLAKRNKEIDRAQAEIEQDRTELELARAQLADVEGDIERRVAEVQRRENALAQRWSRIRAATCSHCGKPTNVNQPPSG